MSEPESAPTQAPISIARYYRLVRDNDNFRRLLVAQIISELGDWFYSVAIYDLVFRLTGSARLVGLVVLVQILPMFFVGPAAGVVNDRFRRKTVMICADLIRAAIVLGMLAVQTRDRLWLLYLLLAAEVISSGFFEPGRSAVIPNLVGEQEAITANALSAAVWSFCLAAGAGIGGLVVHFLGRPSAFLINSLSFLGSAALIARMRFAEPHAFAHRNLRWIDLLGLGPILEGIEYLRGDPRLTSMLFLKFGLGWLGMSMVLLPIMAEREFHVAGAGVLGMSTLFMSRGLGAIIGPFIGGRLAGSSEARMRFGLLLAFLNVGLFYFLLSHAASLAAAAACVVAAHAGGSVIWVFSTTLLQLNSEDRFRGRIFAADFALNVLSASISAYLTGFAIDHGMAPRSTAVGLACMMFAQAAAWALALRLWREPARLPG
jgi:MFS family permease